MFQCWLFITAIKFKVLLQSLWASINIKDDKSILTHVPHITRIDDLALLNNAGEIPNNKYSTSIFSHVKSVTSVEPNSCLGMQQGTYSKNV